MKIGHLYQFPPDKQRLIDKSKHHAWLSIGLMIVASTVMGIMAGQSEAMKTAFIGDLLAIIPPIALLVAMHIERKEPSARFLLGYYRAISIAFLVIATLLLLIGLWLFLDAGLQLIGQQRPTIGTLELFGHGLWAGWGMIGAFAFSASIGLFLGTIKRPVAKQLAAKAIFADADTNKADWMSEGAGIIGIAVVGFGFWWGDAFAAGLISFLIMKDGWHNVKQVIVDLMDETPSILGEQESEQLPTRMNAALRRLDWVERSGIRLREHGHVLCGDVFLVPREGTADLVHRIEEAADGLMKIDWRLYSLTVTPVSRLDVELPPRKL